MTVLAYPHPWPVPSGPSENSVLIVEDDREAREMMAEFLAFCGYAVHVAADGFEAIDTAVRIRPAIILMDLIMPRMDGWEATRRLKADPWTRAIPIIALSAHSAADDDYLARDAGCQDFLSKPCDLDYLATVLRDFFDRRFRASTMIVH